MENNSRASSSQEKQAFSGSKLAEEGEKPKEKTSIFGNNAAIAWHERRKEWIGDQSSKVETMTKDLLINWSTSYEDLLATTKPFPQPIPLTEMVDFLVDIWQEEGLYN